MPSGPEQLRLQADRAPEHASHDSAAAPGAQGARGRLTMSTLRYSRSTRSTFWGTTAMAFVPARTLAALVPPWSLVLSYEHAIRKHAYKVMATAGYSFGAALLHAYKEPSVKERNFTTPLALHAKRPQPWHANTEQPPLKKPHKGKGAKGNGKGKDDKGAKKLKEGSDRTTGWQAHLLPLQRQGMQERR